MAVAFLRGAHNHLRTLPCGSESRRMAIERKVMAVFVDAALNQSHRSENGGLRLIRGKALEARTTTSYKQPLDMKPIEANIGEIVAITESIRKVDQQKSKEEMERAQAIEKWRNWRAPYIQ